MYQKQKTRSSVDLVFEVKGQLKTFDIANVDTLHVCWSVFDYGYFVFVGCGIRYSSC